MKTSESGRATMHPYRVSACIEFGAKHLTHMERQMDEQTDETIAVKTHFLIIRFRTGSHPGQNQPRQAIFAQALQRDGWTDGS